MFSITPGLAMKMAGACFLEAIKAPVTFVRCVAGAVCFIGLAAYMKITN